MIQLVQELLYGKQVKPSLTLLIYSWIHFFCVSLQHHLRMEDGVVHVYASENGRYYMVKHVLELVLSIYFKLLLIRGNTCNSIPPNKKISYLLHLGC